MEWAQWKALMLVVVLVELKEMDLEHKMDKALVHKLA
jgi:hypothetical protein